jgi:hypothetical protein
MAKCLRAFACLKSGKIRDAFHLICQIRHFSALLLTARWALSQIFPGRFHVAPRIPVNLPR